VAILGRRHFLLTAGLASAGALAFDFSAGCSRLVDSMSRDSLHVPNLGPLIPTASLNTRQTVLALPKDFQYTVLGKTGTSMWDGNRTPPAHDGMAAFQVNGELRLVRNHEVNNQTGSTGAAIGANPYDKSAAGGTTTLVINPRTREVVRDFVSLSGTLVNCAGGPTPWNSWISCEETVLGRTRYKNEDGQDQGGFEQHHGYCFEVPAASDKPVVPVPLKAMGRFVHEALAVDPQSGIVYLTEDKGASGFYRFIPKTQGALAAGGRLQMLALRDHPNFDTRTNQKQGASLPVTWVDIPDPDPAAAELDNKAVFKQGISAGAATFDRLEGCLYGRGKIFFTSTSGGDRKLGQVWEYDPAAGKGGALTLLFEPTDAAVMNMPDNLCLTGAGNLMICEDNSTSVHLQLLTRRAEVVTFARNVLPDYETKEFAGVTFSPDGQTLFVNMQVPGLTLAIWGPWNQL
jgi:secreted PhoX family phosphatase